MMTKRPTTRRVRTLARPDTTDLQGKRCLSLRPSSKKRYSSEELECFRNILMRMREEALDELRHYQDGSNKLDMDHSGDGPGDRGVSFMDRSSGTAVWEHSTMLAQRQLKLLEHITSALDRISSGTYGICLSCNTLIAEQRLEAVPHTQLCCGCKEGGMRTQIIERSNGIDSTVEEATG